MMRPGAGQFFSFDEEFLFQTRERIWPGFEAKEEQIPRPNPKRTEIWMTNPDGSLLEEYWGAALRSGHSVLAFEESVVPRVIFEAVTKTFERPVGKPVCALSELSLDVEDGECLGVLGPSGSGKTTALRLVAGLEEPGSGKILIGGKVVNGVAAQERDVAMVFQNPALYPHMSVYDNLAFGLKVRGCPARERDKRVKEVAQLLGVTDCLAARPMELSGGQRQRVSIGRAVVRRPSVLLLDEPLANVDPALRSQMRTEISNLRRQLGTTMIYVTHDHMEALMTADRVAVLRDGKLQQVANPPTLYSNPANIFVASFVGSPPMNLFQGMVGLQGKDLFFEQSTQSEAGSGDRKEGQLSLKLDAAHSVRLAGYVKKSVLLGLRPEQIICVPGEGSPLGWGIRANILAVQTAGPDSFVRAQFGENEFVARVASSMRVLPGEGCWFRFDVERACFFDPLTGETL
jgi:multiple sugar transport system ATP-binding protein